ncbi:hypothetical protein [Denitromonas ohlonensis]|uniref:hypothetical protein n=1 Tax=Denitromonas ohlonensis TaxID=3078508 RepID=UPI001642B7D1|nr:hypothetical protein [Denitromonas ohlonensis]
MQNRPLAIVTLGMALLSGCALTPEGIRLPIPSPDATNSAKLIKNVRDASLKAGARMAIDPLLVAEDRPGIVIIGGLGPVRRLDAQARAEYYQGTTAQAQRMGLPPPMTTEAEFVSGTAGFASVFFAGGFFSLQKYVYAAVPSSLVDALHFPSAWATAGYGGTGDFVVVHTHQDGWNQIVTVLCDDTADDYDECEDQYRRGRYDRTTGYELSHNNEILTDGVRIDPRTYRVVPTEVAQ